MPDHLNLGSVYAGSTIELSARFLTSARKPRIDALFESLVGHCPSTWQPVLSRWHPKHRRERMQLAVDLAKLTPRVDCPTFVRVESLQPERRKEWYDGRPFFVARLKIDTSRPGEEVAEMKVSCDGRWSALPIRLRVLPAPAAPRRMLVTETPYQSDATDDGAQFDVITAVLSRLGMPVDLMHHLPSDLRPYQCVLLGEGTLVHLTENDAAALDTFVESGGRLVIACNAFFVGTVKMANDLLRDRGLQVVDQDHGSFISLSNIISHVLTREVHHLEFQRASLIRVTDPAKAKILVPAPNADGGFLAVANQPNSGEIIVLGQSLWWHWVQQFKENNDNARLLENLLRRASSQPP